MIPAIDQFIENWKAAAAAYYDDLYLERVALWNVKHPVTAETLARVLDIYNNRKYSDARIAEILTQIADNSLRAERYASEINHSEYKRWAKKHTKVDLWMIDKPRADRLEIIDRDAESRKTDLIARATQVGGEVLDASGLYIAENGNIDGYLTCQNGRVKVQTISAGGYNIVCYHYRVLVKLI